MKKLIVFTIYSIKLHICVSLSLLSPASIIYADLSKLALVKSILCHRELLSVSVRDELCPISPVALCLVSVDSCTSMIFRDVTQHEARSNILKCVVAAVLHSC